MSAIPTNGEEARELLRKLQNRMDAFSRWKEATNERVDSLEDENEALRQRIDALEARVQVLEEGSDGGRESKVRDLCDYALNARTGDQRGVPLKAKEIVGAAGVCRRYAYDLIEELPEEHHFLLTLREARNQQYGSLELDAGSYDRALVVDCEALHSDQGAVNKFTTRSGKEGRQE